ncbi:hypothetical protein G7Y79_00011g031210 [Physcia stellaris]|nr:hypothetical protein G7Y79_00011g031210 [Physcia stellaris]
MIVRHPQAISLPSFLLPCLLRCQQPVRHLHRKAQVAASHIPPPTPFVPDSKTFLSLIGRNLTQHAAKIPTWQDLFSYTSEQLRAAGVEPARARRYLLWWRDRYRKGIHGVGGDLEHVVDGTAKLKVVEVPIPGATTSLGIQRTKKFVVNIRPDMDGKDLQVEQLRPVSGMKIVGERTIAGPYIQPEKGTSGSVATMKVQDGMWEERRGVKVDGGERRKAMVRRKRYLEEMKQRK